MYLHYMHLYHLSDSSIVVVLKLSLPSPLTSGLVKYVTKCGKFREFSSNCHQAKYNKYFCNI